jgi:Flp pilus assembly protein TadD
VFTHDAFAWSLAAAGNLAEAHNEMQRALVEGTEDGRLFFHAAIIASRVGHAADAKRWLRKASVLSHLLLPSERNELQNLEAWDAKQNAFSAPSSQKILPLGRKTERKSQNQTKT